MNVRGQRHFIFATPEQSDLLGSAQHLYVNGIFMIVRKPFIQLWNINAFIASGSKFIQVPMLNDLISSCRKSDFVAILRKTNDLVPGFSPLENIADFEAALWTASRVVYPSIQMKCCAFHLCQAIYRKITDLGLGIRCRNNTRTQVIRQKLLSLIFVPVVCV